MGFLDNLSKSLNQGLDRAKFQAEKLQKVVRIQGELSELQKQIDAQRMELADRAIDLYKAGQITSVTVGEIVRKIEGLRMNLTVKEEELKSAQAENYPEPPVQAPSAQQVPISVDPPTQPHVSPPPPSTATRTCPNCRAQLTGTASFCPNCGARVSA